MKSLEERMWRKWGGGEEASARWPERKLRRRPRAIGGGCEVGDGDGDGGNDSDG